MTEPKMIDILKKYLNEAGDYLSGAGNQFILKENQNHGKSGVLSTLYITNVDEKQDVIVYKLDDHFDQFRPDKVFSCLLSTAVKGIHAPCDFVVFHVENDKITVYLCDMKSENPSGCRNKILATRCFIDYLKKVIVCFEQECPESIKNDFTYCYRIVSLNVTSCRHKNPTNPQAVRQTSPLGIGDIAGEKIPVKNLERQNGGDFKGCLRWSEFIKKG